MVFDKHGREIIVGDVVLVFHIGEWKRARVRAIDQSSQGFYHVRVILQEARAGLVVTNGSGHFPDIDIARKLSAVEALAEAISESE